MSPRRCLRRGKIYRKQSLEAQKKEAKGDRRKKKKKKVVNQGANSEEGIQGERGHVDRGAHQGGKDTQGVKGGTEGKNEGHVHIPGVELVSIAIVLDRGKLERVRATLDHQGLN